LASEIDLFGLLLLVDAEEDEDEKDEGDDDDDESGRWSVRTNMWWDVIDLSIS